MKNLIIYLVIFCSLSPLAQAQTAATPAAWVFKKQRGFDTCQIKLKKNVELMLFAEIKGTYGGLVLTMNNKEYFIDEERQEFVLLINGKPIQNTSDLRRAQTLKVLYGRNQSMDVPMNNYHSVVSKCAR